MSEKMKNLVPAAAMSLALVGLSGMKAYAADTEIVPTPSPDTTEPPAESQEQSAVTQSSADINSASKGEVTDGENGEKKNTLTVNADEGGNNGTLDVTTTPGGTTTETTDPVTSTTTDTTENPDGSTDTTTTTTTTSTTTTTTETNTEVKGEITGDKTDPAPVTGDEKDEVVDDLNDALDKEVDDGQTDPDPDPSATPGQPGETETKKPHLEDLKQGDTIGENKEFTVTGTTGTSETTKNEQGQNVTTTTTTVTFEKVEVGETTPGAGLTQEEFGKIVDKQFGLDGVEFTTNENGVISYVDPATGATVTVRLVQNTGTSTTNTTYTIEVSQTKTVVDEKQETGTTDVGGSEEKPDGTTVYDPVEEGKDDPAVVDRFIDTVLNAAENGTKLNGAIPTKVENQDGSITVTAGDRRYDITTTETGLTADQIASVSNEHLVQLLGDGYVLSEDGQKILTADGGYEVDVTTDALTGKAIMRTIKVTDLKDHESDAVNSKTDEEIAADAAQAEENAVKQAAQNAAGAGVTVNVVKENGVWTATWTTTETVGGKTITKNHTATVEATVSTETGEWTTNVKDSTHSSEQTTTNTGNASVTGETIVWNGSTTPAGLTITNGTVTAGRDFFEALYGGGKTVNSVEVKDGKTVVTVTDADGKTHTYNYSFTPADVANVADLSDAEKAALLAGAPAGTDITALNELKRISWTVTEDVDTTNTTSTDVTVVLGGVTQDDKYTFEIGEGESKQTITLDKDHLTQTVGNTTYTLEIGTANVPEVKEENLDAIKGILGSSYANVRIVDGKVIADYTDADGKTVSGVTVQLPETYQTYTVTKQTTTSEDETVAKSGTDAEAAKTALLTEIQSKVSAAMGQNKRTFITINGTEYELSVQNNQLVGMKDGAIIHDFTESTLTQWIEENTVVNFDALSEQALITYLEGLKNSDSEAWMDRGHLDLVIGSELKVDGKEDPEDCVLVKDDNLKVTVGKTAEDVVTGPTAEDATREGKFKDDIIYDGYAHSYQYEHEGIFRVLEDDPNKTFSNNKPDVSHTSDYKYYKIEGTVAHGKVKTYASEEAANTAKAKLSEEERQTAVVVKTPKIGSDGKVVTKWEQVWKLDKWGYGDWEWEEKTVYEYTLYKYTSNLEAYGYLGNKSNDCDSSHKGYDLKLTDLTLLPDGRVTANGANTHSYSVTLTTKTTEDENIGNGTSLGVANTVTTGGPGQEDRDDLAGSKLTGGYELTETKKTEDLKDSKGDWAYQGSDSTSYDSYKTWVAEEMGSFTATSTEYTGSLGTSYTKPGSTTYEKLQVGKNAAGEDSVTKTLQTVRDLVASLQSTSVQQTTNSDTTTNTEHQAPREDPPEVDIPEEEPPLVDTPDEDPPEVDVPDEEPPVVDAPDEEPPLVDVPDEEPPVVDMPEEEPPVVDIPDEAPPMVDMPVEAPPVVDVADPVVPLADVPQTGDNVMLRVAAAITGLFSTLGLAVLTQKKREDEAN